jgi:hypothetical protein
MADAELDAELVALLIGVLAAVVGIASFPPLRLPVGWSASTILVRLAVVLPQALPFLSWQPWCLAAAILGLAGALVTVVLMYQWVLQGNIFTQPPGTPPLFSAFLPGIFLSVISAGGPPVPPWIELALTLNVLLIVGLLFVGLRMRARQAQQAQNNSGAGSAS